MASVKYSSIVDEIKGRIGNVVFQRMGSSYGIRSQVSNAFSKSKAAVDSRNLLTSQALRWNALSAADKKTWIDIAPTWPAKDRYGVAISLTGYQLFIQVSLLLLSCGLSTIDVAQPFVLPDTFGIVVDPCTVAAQEFYVHFTGPGFANQKLLIYCSQEYPSYSKDANPKLYFVDNVGLTGSADINLYDKVLARSSAGLHAGKAVFIEIIAIDPSSGSYVVARSEYIQIV